MSTDTNVDFKELVCELCRQFFNAGWVTGTGGSISIRDNDQIYMTPSGVQKERIKADEIFTVDINGNVIDQPAQKPGCRVPKLSDCSPLFLHAYQQRNAGAVLHSHAISCNIVTTLFEGLSEFKISHQEMIKGIDGYGYFDTLTIPIIENTAWEHELADSLGETIAKYPKACAVLVRRHGMYVWGNSWEQAKRHGECLHYLFDIAIKMHQLGLDFNSAPLTLGQPNSLLIKRRTIDYVEQAVDKKQRKEPKFKYLLLDIEGTTTPITFVKEVLFPYAAENLESYLKTHWLDVNTQSIIEEFKQHAKEDPSSPTAILNSNSLEAVVEYGLWCIKLDKKLTPLKKLQGLIWESGYKSGKLLGQVYDDVFLKLNELYNENVKICIYSSGSKHAQQLLFGYSNHGDLRKYITCHFDTSVGQKYNPDSYKEILLTLGIDNANDALFITDILAEAKAANSLGIQVLLSVRPGNATIIEETPPLGFKTITSFEQF